MPKYPLIQGILTQNGGGGENSSQVPFVYDQRKTPAEILLLLHVHNAEIGADAEVISDAKWTGDVEMAENDLRADLSNRYGADVVQMMFPGSLPTTTHYPDGRKEWQERHNRAVSAGDQIIEDAKAEAADVDQNPQPADVMQEIADPLADKSKAELRDMYKELQGKAAPGFYDEDYLRFQVSKLQAKAKAD